ncbi:D-alanine--D-alanine ligase [bacterium]|nr:D-alanine--D-alanine ligase [bacterium]
MARILVIGGGDNLERRVSLASADAVATGLANIGHDVFKLDTAKPESILDVKTPLLDGIVGPTPPDEANNAKLDRKGWATLVKILSNIKADAVFPILHGSWGEDGRIQALLELLGFPYLGSGVLASQLAMNKVKTKEIAVRMGLPCAEHLVPPVEMTDKMVLASVKSRIGFPNVIKPVSSGSAVDVYIIHKENDFIPALKKVRHLKQNTLIERYIPGKELTVTILGQKALPVIEIAPKSAEFYDYTRKYTKGETTYLCPAPIDKNTTIQLMDMSLKIFQALDCKHVARVDWRLDSRNRLFFLEINTIPGMTELSLVPMAAKEVGYPFDSLMGKFVELILGEED